MREENVDFIIRLHTTSVFLDTVVIPYFCHTQLRELHLYGCQVFYTNNGTKYDKLKGYPQIQ